MQKANKTMCLQKHNNKKKRNNDKVGTGVFRRIYRKGSFCKEQCWFQVGLEVCDDDCLCLNLNEGNGDTDGQSSFSTYHSQGIPKTPSKNSYDFTRGAELDTHYFNEAFH